MQSQIDDSYLSDYISLIFDTFTELRGDRKSGDDRFVIGGLARLGEYKVVVIGYRGDGSLEMPGAPGPSGYRKCSRLLRLAETFGKPVIVFINIPVSALLPAPEQQQIDEAAARSLEEMSCLKTPVIGVVIGKSIAGAAMDLCAVDRALMLEDAGCEDAANDTDTKSLYINAQDLLALKVVHRTVKGSPVGELESTANALKEAISEELRQLSQIHLETLVRQRLERLQGQCVNFSDAGIPSDKMDNVT